MPADLIVRSSRVITPGGLVSAEIHVRDGRIASIEPRSARAGADVDDVGEAVVMAGVIDTHVHVNEPGRTDWEGFTSATRAAAAGGVTTIVDMPLNSIPSTTTPAALELKRREAHHQCHVDVGFWAGVVPGNVADLAPLAAAGALGFKCFMCPSGVDEFEAVGERDLKEAMPILGALGLPLLAHAELPRRLAACPPTTRYADYLASRPPAAEDEAIELLVSLARAFGTRTHVVHVASSSAVPLIARARGEGLAFSAETCPHYLFFSAEGVPDRSTEYKCAPPIREREHQERLWQALDEGTIGSIASDHSPAPPALKQRERGDFAAAWGGISSLQLLLPIVWTGARRRGFGVERLAEWLSAAPARLAGLDARKGSIAEGLDADFVVWDPDGRFEVDPAALHHRHRLTPYGGAALEGRVIRTYVRGRTVYDRGSFPPPAGALIAGRSARAAAD
jgi:allantoinase